MKKIINGRRYDTESAKELGYDSYGTPSSFAYWCETLYQKRTGEFFLHCEGGAMSRYAVNCGQNEWRGGERLIPLTVEKAKKWAEERLSTDRYEEIFGAVSEDDGKRTVTYSLPESTIAKIKAISLETNRTFSEVVADAIEKL